MSAEELVEQSRALLAKMPDAARIGIDSEVLAGLCDALAAAEKRADEAEAGAAAMHQLVGEAHGVLLSLGGLHGMMCPAYDNDDGGECDCWLSNVVGPLRSAMVGAWDRAFLDRLHAAESERDALAARVDAEKRRADEAEARERDAANACIEASHDLHIRLEQDETACAVMQEALHVVLHDCERGSPSAAKLTDLAISALAPTACAAFLARLHAAEDIVRRVEDMLGKCPDGPDGGVEELIASHRRVIESLHAVESERDALRRVVSECAAAIGNGSGGSVDASVEFMSTIPTEIRAETSELRAERDRAAAQRDKALSDLAGLDGRLSGIHDHFRFELNKACGVNAHLQAHNDHLVEINAALKSQVAEAGLCRELIAERDALRAEVERLRPFEAKEMQRREIFDALNRIGNAPSDD